MSKIRFTQTVRGTLHVQVPVHTEQGLRTAAIEMLLQEPTKGFSREEARAAVSELLGVLNTARTGARKAGIEEGAA